MADFMNPPNSSGTKATGFIVSDLGPHNCGNCQKFQDHVCYEPEVAKDKDIPDMKNRKMDNGGVKVSHGETCCFFLSRMDKKKWDGKLPAKPKKSDVGKKIFSIMGQM